MKTTNRICRVIMEPVLEAEACLWTAEKCRMESKKLKRWARQLDMRAKIMDIDRRRAYAAKPTPSLKVLPRHLLRRN